jgi:DnaJ-class molecular chaperone
MPKHTNCRHTPDAIAPFWHTCTKCGLPIEPVKCVMCDGDGVIAKGKTPCSMKGDVKCRNCNGTGASQWNLIS